MLSGEEQVESCPLDLLILIIFPSCIRIVLYDVDIEMSSVITHVYAGITEV